MIPLTVLCDEYIDRPKLSEQKKPFEYIVPPPTSAVGTTITKRYLCSDKNEGSSIIKVLSCSTGGD